MNLKDLSLKQLLKLQSDVEIAIERAKTKDLQIAKKELEKAAQKMGYSLAELVDVPADGASARKPKSKPVRPKYQNPENKTETWTGRGRQPLWVRHALDTGATLDDLLIR